MTPTLLWYSILVVCFVFVLNFGMGVFLYVKRTKFDPLVALSPQQKKLLGVRNDGMYHIYYCGTFKYFCITF